MCKACPRELNVKRYWRLNYWSKPSDFVQVSVNRVRAGYCSNCEEEQLIHQRDIVFSCGLCGKDPLMGDYA